MKHLIYILPIALTLAACSASDELITPESTPTTPPLTEANSIIIGGNTTLPTRSYPVKAGDCRADRALLRFFRGHDNHLYVSNADLSPSDMTHKSDATISLQPFIYNGYAVRQGSYEYHVSGMNIYNEAFAISCLGYNSTETGWWDAAMTNDKMANQFVTLKTNQKAADGSTKRIQTPDLYFGPLMFESNTITNSDKKRVHNENYGIHYYHVGAAVWDNFDNDQGYVHNLNIFRIVSQINLTVKNVPLGISRMELITTRVPIQIRLHGNHGGTVYKEDVLNTYIYPVTAAIEAQCLAATDTCVIAEADLSTNFTEKATAVLSSYLLPSELGMEMKLRVWYKTASLGHTDYTIMPFQSALLTGENANYSVPASNDERRKSASELYVYNPDNHKFFSYSNVKVNITGDYEAIATPTSWSAYTIDVEPAFEQTHDLSSDVY